MAKRYLKVITETPYDTIYSYSELDGTEKDKQLANIAQDLFHNECSYGYEVVDEADVPEDDR